MTEFAPRSSDNPAFKKLLGDTNFSATYQGAKPLTSEGLGSHVA